VIAELDPKFAWYVSRSAGLVCWVLCGVAIIWGLGLSTKLVRRRGLPAWLLDLHSFLGMVALVFCGVHIAGLVADNFTHWGWRELLVPMESTWKPGPTAWGIVAFYLLMAVQITSWLRKYISKKLWHTVHLSSFGLFIAGSVHGIQAGTDWSNTLVRTGAALVAVLVGWWSVMRWFRRSGKLPATGPVRGARIPAGARQSAKSATPGPGVGADSGPEPERPRVSVDAGS